MTETQRETPGDVAPSSKPPVTEQAGLEALAADLHKRRQKALAMGGPERIERQHGQSKLTARERLDLLFDEGTFVEFGLLATGQSMKGESYDPDKTPADGVVTGHGKVDGRDVYVAAYDFTVMAGSMGMVGEQKVARLRELALRNRCPIVWLLDSAGARIQDATGSMFAGTRGPFWGPVHTRGVLPPGRGT